MAVGHACRASVEGLPLYSAPRAAAAPLAARCSSLAARRSLLVARCSSLVTRRSPFTMKVTLAVCMALLAIILVQAEDGMAPAVLPVGSRIANGIPAAPREFSYMAFIVGNYWCAGSLITRSAVLTTAWCIDGATNYTVRLGSIYRKGEDPNAWSVESTWAMKHPKYSSANKDYNIAIIALPRRAPVNEFIQPVSLPSSPDNSSYLGRQAIVAGWGWTAPSSGMSDVLRWAKVQVLHNDFCKQFITPFAVTDRQLCAGSENTTVYWDDYGAPLVLNAGGRYTQIGVFSMPTSWEFNPPHSSIYIRVTSFLDWIKLYTESE